MALKAVLFDMDGVIVNTEPLHRKAYNRIFKEENIEVPDAFYASLAGSSTYQVWEAIIKEFGLKGTKEDYSLLKRTYFKEFFDSDPDFDLIPGVRQLIEHYHSHGIKLVLATSATRVSIELMFNRFQLDPYFIGKVSGAELKESKPHPEIFLRAAEIAGEPLENCMVIEDATNGILAAHRAGIFCTAYKSPNTHLQDYSLANLVVSDMQELQLETISPYFP